MLYDWFSHHHVVWPSLACRWGRTLDSSKYKTKQRFFYSEQTEAGGSSPNTLIMANVDVIKPRVASADNVAFRWNERGKSPFVKRVKTIFHPGEVNKIREVFTKNAGELRVNAEQRRERLRCCVCPGFVFSQV